MINLLLFVAISRAKIQHFFETPTKSSNYSANPFAAKGVQAVNDSPKGSQYTRFSLSKR